MKKLLIYGEFTSIDEINEILSESKGFYDKIVIANHYDSKFKYKENSQLLREIDFYVEYKTLNELQLFETMEYDIKSLNEFLYESYDYKISLIIPVYNTQEYIQETLNSIINQSMDLKDIQIIIINDGSTDNSDFILHKYQKMYPHNIKYIYKKNEGVSIARNIGLKYVKGKYVNFIDSDDKWGLTTLKNVYDFFEQNPSIDVVSCRLRFFDNMVGEHPLNYKYHYKENKVVDLKYNYDFIQMNASSAFFRSSTIKDIKFDTSLKYAEDAKFVYNVLKQKFKMGLMSYTQACYWYRKRNNETSAIDTALSKEIFYSPTIERFHNYLVDDYHKNNIPKYVQMMILYDLQYRLRYQNITLSTLTSKELDIYTNQIINLLKLMDDDVILNPNLTHITAIYQVAILSVKYEGANFTIKLENGQYKIYSNNIFIKNVSDMYLKAEYLYEKNKIIKCGYSLPNINMNIDIIPVFIINNNEMIRPINETTITEQKFLNKNISYNKFYRFDIPLNKKIKKLELKYLINNKNLEKINQVSKTHNTNFSNTKTPFKQYTNKTLKLIDNKIILNGRRKLIPVIKNILGLLKNSKTRKSGIYKLIGLITKKINNKNIWLFIDRLDKAGDNAEALFEFVINNHPKVSPYFLINLSSPDYILLRKKYGKRVVAFNSKKHHLLMFIANKVFSSHSEANLNNPFGTINGKFIRELLDFEFIFLQHGVIQNDLSTLLHKRNKPMDYFITSSEKEKNEIIQKYGFTEQEVILSGLPRFDLLKSIRKKRKKVITIMPTWRPHLLETSDEKFLESDFFKGFFELMSSPQIQKLASTDNHIINLCLHPRMQARFSKFFNTIPYVNILNNFSYTKILSETDLLITDVSSIAFDMAYLKKPIIYYHFDIDDIYKYAAYIPGYFNYSTDGFGPVISNPKALVNEIIKLKSKNYKNPKLYNHRISTFFKYTDSKNRYRTLSLTNTRK